MIYGGLFCCLYVGYRKAGGFRVAAVSEGERSAGQGEIFARFAYSFEGYVLPGKTLSDAEGLCVFLCCCLCRSASAGGKRCRQQQPSGQTVRMIWNRKMSGAFVCVKQRNICCSSCVLLFESLSDDSRGKEHPGDYGIDTEQAVLGAVYLHHTRRQRPESCRHGG